MAWECEDCGRSFGKAGQQHDCRPGLSLEEFLAGARHEADPIFGTIAERLRSLEGGDLIIDPLEGKVLFKNGPTIAVLDSMKKWVALGFTLRRRLESPRLSRKVTEYNGRFHHVVNLTDAAQIDDELLDWLTEAFYRDEWDGDTEGGGGSMVPDDVDVEF